VCGGANGGDGGFVETSAANIQIAATTKVDTRATAGRAGTWLIDPADFTIASGNTGGTVRNAYARGSVIGTSTLGGFDWYQLGSRE
jgi:hypothetical protein